MTDFNQDIDKCLEILHAGGIILYPTDTIWGLGCDATNDQAVENLITLKGKPESKGLIILLANERDVLQYVAGPDLQIFDFLQTLEKPTTVIYDHGLGVSEQVLNCDGSIAIRLVNEEFCRHLLKRFKKPIVSTSANFHGQPSPQKFSDISLELKQKLDYVVSYRQEDVSPSKASSLIKWKNGEVMYIRR